MGAPGAPAKPAWVACLVFHAHSPEAHSHLSCLSCLRRSISSGADGVGAYGHGSTGRRSKLFAPEITKVVKSPHTNAPQGLQGERALTLCLRGVRPSSPPPVASSPDHSNATFRSARRASDAADRDRHCARLILIQPLSRLLIADNTACTVSALSGVHDRLASMHTMRAICIVLVPHHTHSLCVEMMLVAVIITLITGHSPSSTQSV